MSMNNQLTAEQVRNVIFDNSVYASYDGAQHYANGINMQAIADELNKVYESRCYELESLIRDMWFNNIGRMDTCGYCIVGCDDEDPCYFQKRMSELGVL